MSRSRKAVAVKASVQRSRKSARSPLASPEPKRKTKTAPITAKASAGDAAIGRSKKAIIIALLQRSDGAPISELTGATGWQAHSVRAALTGLRKEGKELLRVRNATGITHYRIAAEASA